MICRSINPMWLFQFGDWILTLGSETHVLFVTQIVLLPVISFVVVIWTWHSHFVLDS